MAMAQSEWPELTRKRSREEVETSLGFEEHRNKRIQTLPLRTSPSSKRIHGPPSFQPAYPNLAYPQPPHTITPGDSDSEELNAYARPVEPQTWADCPELVAQQPSPNSLDVDNDMDMSDAIDPSPAPDGAGQRLEPGPLQPDPIAPCITGRMPTPIHATFVAQVRGNNWGGAAGNVMGAHATANGAAFRTNAEADAHQLQYFMGHESVPRSLDGAAATEAVMADWSMVQNRRLPSPISESGGEDVLGSPTMVLDASTPMGQMNQHGHMHPMLSGLPPRANSAMELGQTPRPESYSSPPRATTPGADESPNGSAMEIEPPATPSPRRGHTRSRHTLNSWTATQPGMKKSFSIGYRADCEKCRQKVPGHFNHIIIS